MKSVVETVADALVFVICLSVVDWGGEEKGHMLVRLSDTVLVGQKQITEQTGIPVSAQRMVFGETELNGSMLWGSFHGLRDGSTVQLTVVVNQVICISLFFTHVFQS